MAVLFFSGCGGKKTTSEQSGAGEKPAVQQQEKKEGLFQGSLKDLMGRGTSQVCTWSFEDNEAGASSGKLYISGNKFYQEFKTTGGPEGQALESYVINDGEWIYQWNSITQTGTKIKIEDMEKMEQNQLENPETGTGEKAEVVDWDKRMEYDCESWVADDSKFKVPEDKEFTDLNSMLETMQKGVQEMGQQGARMETMDPCQICESLPAEAKGECLKSCQQ